MKVVILGCGFGGVEVALTLSKQTNELELVMIDRSTRFDYQPAYPELLSGKVTPEEISADISTFAAKIGARFLHAEVQDINFHTQTVTLEAITASETHEVPYDFLVLALGAEQTFFGIPGAEEFSYTVNTMAAAMETKNALEQLEYSKEPNIFVIGGGLSGIEVTGELVDYLKARDVHARIFLVEMMPRLLPAFPRARAGNYVSKFLRARGVEIMTNTAVQAVEKREILFRAVRKLPYELIIWTAGIKPGCCCEQLDLPKQKGWLKVDPYLRIVGMETAFAVGDAACFESDDGLRSGQNVEEAEAQGVLAAQNILRTLQGERLRAYKPKNTVQNPRAIISLGGDKAVVYSKWFMFTTLAYRIKKFIERRYMKRFT